jgi:diguanylate cyclase (GGDEF)-like protein
MHRRLLPINARLLVLIVAMVLPFIGAYDAKAPLIPSGIAIVVFGIFQRRAASFARPELWVFFALLGTEVAIGSAATMAGLQHSGALVMICWPATGVCGRFRALPVVIGTGFAVIVMAACSLLFDGAVTIANPLGLTLPLAALICVCTVAMALRESDIEHRGAAVLDPLTGMLNRSALNGRVAEIEEQSKLTGQPVGLIVADLDHFKAVNDTHGHAVGDAVLRHVAYVLRRELRAYDLAYRLGGEEFAIVLLGANVDDAATRAEQLRAAIAAEPFEDLAITASFGVAASQAHHPFLWSEQFERADAALYAAKGGGRDAVRVAGRPVAVPATV